MVTIATIAYLICSFYVTNPAIGIALYFCERHEETKMIEIKNLDGVTIYTHDGDTLQRAKLWEANLQRADLREADLREADLWGADLQRADLQRANLRGANLWWATGNGFEIKTIQTDIWKVNYTADRMQIGCENHAILDWWEMSDEAISAMEKRALEWWTRWKPVLKTIIEISPATPTGKE
ncbi:MAG: hypothetical protein E6R04_06480 [Spirochaetes bacterium]|nr:MAG: hypothetical protein E6R04_06480 [Spirochaetota bacterium]